MLSTLSIRAFEIIRMQNELWSVVNLKDTSNQCRFVYFLKNGLYYVSEWIDAIIQWVIFARWIQISDQRRACFQAPARQSYYRRSWSPSDLTASQSLVFDYKRIFLAEIIFERKTTVNSVHFLRTKEWSNAATGQHEFQWIASEKSDS